MAKTSKPITVSEDDLKNLDAIREKYQKLSEQYEEIRRKGAAITNDEKRRKAFLERKIERQGAYLEKLEQQAKIEEGIAKRTEKFNKNLQRQVESLGEADEIYSSIAEKIGKQSEGGELISRHYQTQKAILAEVASLSSEAAGKDADRQKLLQKALSDYKKYETSVANTVQRVSEGSLSQEKANLAIAKAKAGYMESLESLTNMGEKGEQLLELFKALADNTVQLGSAASKTAEAFNIMEDMMARMGSHLPVMSEISEVIKKAEEGGKAFTVAMAALGAVVGSLAGKYLLAFPQAKIQALNEISQSTIETARDVAKIKFDTKFIPDKTRLEINKMLVESEFERSKAVKKVNDLQTKGSAEYRRVLQGVNVEIQQGAMQFAATSKTALFGKGIGSVGYAKSQLVAAGVSAEDVANNIKQAGVVMGQMPSAETAATMALMEKRTGVSAESIAQINKSFIKLDGLSETAAMNMQQGMTALAESSNIPLDNLMQEVAGSAKSMLGYGIKNTSNLIKQAAAVSSMGVSFQEVANAGKSMVLNYKDSIKAEMQLSSLLGEQVDLSEVRAQMASGDYKGAIQSLQAQGLDIQEMNQFQLEALSQSLGGMDVGTMTSLLTGKMKEPGELKASDAKAAGSEFAAKKMAEKAEIALGSAVIQAKDAKAQIQFDKEIQKEILNSDFYNQYQLNQAALDVANRNLEGAMDRAWKATDTYAQSIADLAKLDVEKSFTENIIPALSSALGAGLFAAMAGGGFGKIFGGLGNLFKFGGGAAGAAPMGGAGGGLAGGAGAMGGAGAAPAGTTGIGGFLSNLGAGIGNLLKSIGTGAGQAIGGFFQGMTSGLLAFANAMATPTPLFGLPAGLIIVGMAMGIAKALEIAAPGIKALTPLLLGLASIVGDTFVKAMYAAGPVITAIFEGMGNVITSVGSSISEVITTVTDSIYKLSSLPAENLFTLGAGLTAVAAGLATFTGGQVVSSIGGAISSGISFLTGSGGGDIFSKLTEFSNKANQLNMVANSVRNLSSALAEMAGITFNNVNALNDLPWVRMTAFAAAGGTYPISAATTQKTVSTSSKAITGSDAALVELKAINTNTKAMLELTKAMEVIAAAQYQYATTKQAPIQLKVDGKTLATAQVNYSNNNKGQKAPGK
jgi:hypothetical protein